MRKNFKEFYFKYGTYFNQKAVIALHSAPISKYEVILHRLKDDRVEIISEEETTIELILDPDNNCVFKSKIDFYKYYLDTRHFSTEETKLLLYLCPELFDHVILHCDRHLTSVPKIPFKYQLRMARVNPESFTLHRKCNIVGKLYIDFLRCYRFLRSKMKERNKIV